MSSINSIYGAPLTKIDFNSKDIIEPFLIPKIDQNEIYGVYHYCWNYYYNQLIGNHKHYYGIKEIKGDKVLFVIAKVNFMTTQYDRLMNYPLSLAGNKENEDAVFDWLLKSGVKQAYLSNMFANRLDPVVYSWDIKEQSWADSDFYCFIPDELSLFNNRYKTHYRINALLNNPDFVYAPAELRHKEDIRELCVAWQAQKGNGIFSKKLFQNYLEYYNQNIYLQKLKQFVLLYKGKVMALTVFAPMFNGEYCHKLIQWSYKRGYLPEDFVLDKILSQLGQNLHYLYVNELNKQDVKYLSCAGGAGSSKLYSHKKGLYPRVLPYYKVERKGNEL